MIRRLRVTGGMIMTEYNHKSASIPAPAGSSDGGSTVRVGEGLIIKIWRSLNPWWSLPESYWPF
jgi:hypothetical protein